MLLMKLTRVAEGAMAKSSELVKAGGKRFFDRK